MVLLMAPLRKGAAPVMRRWPMGRYGGVRPQRLGGEDGQVLIRGGARSRS
jgi:hypothetical protein